LKEQMMNRYQPLLILVTVLVGCSNGGSDSVDAGGLDTGMNADTGVDPDSGTEQEEARVGFEILQIRSPTEILVWFSADLTQQEFNAIDLPQGWFKNQPREGEADSGFFARSPNASADGEFTREMHFGHEWLHNATVIETNVPVDAQGLLRLNRVAKFHTITFNAGRTLSVLVSPQGESYVRVSRDAGRSTDVPTIPSDWQLREQMISESLTIELPNPTDNIRADNEDSWQGPVPGL
jgi:hypothetical protein